MSFEWVPLFVKNVVPPVILKNVVPSRIMCKWDGGNEDVCSLNSYLTNPSKTAETKSKISSLLDTVLANKKLKDEADNVIDRFPNVFTQEINIDEFPNWLFDLTSSDIRKANAVSKAAYYERYPEAKP